MGLVYIICVLQEQIHFSYLHLAYKKGRSDKYKP